MTSRKKIHRARRQTLGMLTEATAALAKGEVALAGKLVARALEAGFMNARVHADAALLLADMGRRGDAESAARHAEALAPGAEFVRATLVELGLESALPAGRGVPVAADVPAPAAASVARRWTCAAAWSDLERHGVAVVTDWLSPEEAAELVDLDESAPVFVAARPLATPAGTLDWAAFQVGVLPALDAILADAYACARDLASAMAAALGEASRFPATCPAPAPHVDRAVRLRLRGGASLPVRTDRGDRDAFPLRACLALGPEPLRLILADLRPGRRRERAVSVPARAAAWFCARERPVRVGGVLGLQPLAWGLAADAEAAVGLTSWLDVRAPA